MNQEAHHGLRSFALLRQFEIEFKEHVIEFYD
jgi:hypothetical protein